jgi:hypothetical protein
VLSEESGRTGGELAVFEGILGIIRLDGVECGAFRRRFFEAERLDITPFKALNVLANSFPRSLSLSTPKNSETFVDSNSFLVSAIPLRLGPSYNNDTLL